MPTDSPPKENKGQRSSSSSWRPRARAWRRCKRHPQHKETPRKIDTSAETSRRSIDWFPSSKWWKWRQEGSHHLEHVLKIWEQINKADNVHSMRGLGECSWTICLWAAFYLGEECRKFKIIVMNRAITPKHIKNYWSCANQTWTPQKYCLRIVWKLITAKLEHRILE